MHACRGDTEDRQREVGGDGRREEGDPVGAGELQVRPGRGRGVLFSSLTNSMETMTPSTRFPPELTTVPVTE